MFGGTAVALHLGLRRSIDFDLFTYETIKPLAIKRGVLDCGFVANIINEKNDQIHFTINNVKVTFFEYPFNIEANLNVSDSYLIPDLITLAAMKTFSLGGRAKCKDYEDLYFIIKSHHSLREISNKAKEIFKDVFNPILFCRQICYFKDINYDEQLEFMPGFELENKEINIFLIDAALERF